MKLVGTLSLLGLACASSPTSDRQWLAWKREHKVSFATAKEETSRYNTFSKMRAFVSEHNAKAARGEETYTVALNKFAAMEQEEFRSKYLQPTRDYSDKRIVMEYACPNNYAYNGDAIPAAVSYVSGETDAANVRVTPVKDQGQCGSCWTFGTGAAIEGALCGAGAQDCNTWQGVSTQQLVDCCSYTPQTSQSNPLVNNLNPYDSHGCSGGWMSNAMRCVIMQGGIQNWADYGYTSGTTGLEGDCVYDDSMATSKISSCGSPTSGDETQLAEVLAQVGPATIAIDASGIGFQLYSGGVYSNNGCSTTALNHAVTNVGYGRYLDGQLYWEVKNSWGTGWGMAGYILMARDQGNMCGVATDAEYAIV